MYKARPPADGITVIQAHNLFTGYWAYCQLLVRTVFSLIAHEHICN